MNNSKARMQLAQGYAMPIAGAALGTIVGLMLNDLLPNRYEAWTWVIVQLILGVALVWGTRAATNARNFELAKKKSMNANGARIMNFVLSIIWSAVMGIMALTFIANAVGNLKNWAQPSKVNDPNAMATSTIMPLTGENFVRDFLPAGLLLVIFLLGTLLWLVNRAREE